MAAANYIPSVVVPQRAPDFVVHGAVAVAPVINSILATSPALPGLSPANHLIVVARIQGDTATQTYEILHLNGAGSVVDTCYLAAGSVPGDWWGIFNLTDAGGDTIEVTNLIAGTASDNYQVDLYGWRY
jgi:hypothetical protein